MPNINDEHVTRNGQYYVITGLENKLFFTQLSPGGSWMESEQGLYASYFLSITQQLQHIATQSMKIRTRSYIDTAIVILLLNVLPQIGVMGKSAGEYEVKAAFLYNFAQFAEWPPNVFQDSKAPIVIGVFGQDPFGSTLDEAVKNKAVNGRRFVVKRFKTLKDIECCQILYVSASEEDHVKKAARASGGKGVLTVGESAHFIDRGGIIKFTIDNSKIGLEISVEHAKDAGLKFISKLLRLAKIV